MCKGGGCTLHTPTVQRHATNMCIHSIQVCFSALSCSLFYTPERTPTHTPQSCTDSLTHFSPLSSFAHTETHTDMHMAYTQQHQTQRLTDTLTHAPVARGRWGGGENPSSKCSLGAHTHTHTHRSAHMSTHPNEVEQRAQRQHVEAPVGTP